MAVAEEGIRLMAEAGIEAIGARSQALTALAMERHDEEMAGLGCTWASPGRWPGSVATSPCATGTPPPSY